MSVLRRGVVTEFDEERGLGAVTDAASGEVFPFHCTAVSDGSRTIPVGAPVAFLVAPVLLGRIEAAELMPLTPAG